MELFGLAFLGLLLVVLLAVVVPAMAIWLAVKVVGLLFSILGLGGRVASRGTGRVGRFLAGMASDAPRLLGHVLTAAVSLPLALGNLVFLRTHAAAELVRTAGQEFGAAFACFYRLGLGHPLRLLGLHSLVAGLERRIPDALERAESRSRETRRRAPRNAEALPELEGYKILRELTPGGSGARLFVASPTGAKAKELRGRRRDVPDHVVVKRFTIGAGSTLPQILRESRSLEPAGRLGLVLDSTLDEESFQYVMPYVPGPSLDQWTHQLHERGPLGPEQLRDVLKHARRLSELLGRFHAEGLWHKDIKPANLILGPKGLEIVDLGLVTPLASAMTLTTHGTEYYRDPELVRLAMKGVRVHEVDGAKFDLYGAGAVLFSMVEGSFPANGSLSPFEKDSPEALRFIVRRCMADLASRYASAEELAMDLRYLEAQSDLSAVKPFQLPSMSGSPVPATSRTEDVPTGRAGIGASEGLLTREARAAGWEVVSGPSSRRRGRRRSTTRAALVGALGLLAAGAAAFFLAKPDALESFAAPSIQASHEGIRSGSTLDQALRMIAPRLRMDRPLLLHPSSPKVQAHLQQLRPGLRCGSVQELLAPEEAASLELALALNSYDLPSASVELEAALATLTDPADLLLLSEKDQGPLHLVSNE